MLILYAHGLIVIAFTIRILLRDDLSPTARLAWFIVLNVMPFAGTVVYFLFGEVDLGKRAIRRHDAVFTEIRNHLAAIGGQPDDASGSVDPAYRQAFKYAASINGMKPVDGNRAELLEDATTARARLIEDIDAATDHVHVLYYIWLKDGTGTNVARALIRAAKRGVTCRAMADGHGSRALIRSSLWKEMKDAGVQVATALPLNRPLRVILTSRIDLRNHRKITVIDGRITYCGSQNCADPEFRVKAKYAPWVDIMLRLEGPVVAQNQLLFASDWMQETGERIEAFDLGPPSHETGFTALAMGDGPTERRSATPQLFAAVIGSAQAELTISTPYFVPDPTVVDALCAAIYRGVGVALIFPERNDSWIVSAASRSYYRKLLSAGAKIHEFRDGLLHSKTMTVDGKLCLVGSANIDLRSFDLNYENNILIWDESITGAVRRRQQDYIDRSLSVTLDAVEAWSYPRRIWNNVIATIGPVL